MTSNDSSIRQRDTPTVVAALPLWRRGFDLVEGGIRPRLEQIIGAEQFAVAVGLVTHAQRAAQRSSERATRRILHSWNLPAGSDINRILTELGRLERQVNSLKRELATAKGGLPDANSTGAKRSARTTKT